MASTLMFHSVGLRRHAWRSPQIAEDTHYFRAKVAAMALFARVVHDAFGGVVADWQQVLSLLAVLSMFLGAIAAIGQRVDGTCLEEADLERADTAFVSWRTRRPMEARA